MIVKYLQQLLGYKKENILYYPDATGNDLRTVFGDRRNPGRLSRFLGRRKAEVFIYYVGHGAPDQNGEAYLVPVDAQIDYIATTGYPLNQLYNIVEKLPAKNVTLVIDACFSGNTNSGKPLVEGVSPVMLKNLKPIREVAGSVIFSSADKDQLATWYPQKRHSTFTYYFLKGISGAADSNGNKRISVAEMKDYLQEEVYHTALRLKNRDQIPQVAGDGAYELAWLR